jgi:hypothetical protein
MLLSVASATSLAQTIEVPRDAVAPGTKPQDQFKPFDTKHLADRPYTFDMPKPQFPSTDRVQREFVVEYVYDYALSRYTPQVSVTIVARAQAKHDTPENTVIAFFSAMQTGDYDAWLSCWDAAARADFEKGAQEQKQDAAFWKKMWAGLFVPNTKVALVDRVETQSYVILDAHVPGKQPFDIPTVVHFEKGEWKVTNDLQSNAILTSFHPGLAGELNLVPPLPRSTIATDNLITAAQDAFINQHTKRDRVIEVGH